MAIIECPSCSKRTSDKAPRCSHCDLDLQNVDKDKIKQIKRVNNIKKSQQMMTWSFIAMLLFCGGFLSLYWYNAEPGTITYTASLTSIVVGFVLYIVTRVRILLLKRNK
jgi:hypothetical protein